MKSYFSLLLLAMLSPCIFAQESNLKYESLVEAAYSNWLDESIINAVRSTKEECSSSVQRCAAYMEALERFEKRLCSSNVIWNVRSITGESSGGWGASTEDCHAYFRIEKAKAE